MIQWHPLLPTHMPGSSARVRALSLLPSVISSFSFFSLSSLFLLPPSPFLSLSQASEFVWGASEFSLSDEVLDPEPQVPASTASVEGVEGDGDDVDGGKIWM